VWTVDVVNGEAMHPTEVVSAANAAAMHPAWSPDGNRIVFVTVLEPDRSPGKRPHESDVWVIGYDGTARTNLTNGKFLNLYPTWGADGTVYFLSNRSGTDNIWAVATSRMLGPNHVNDMPLVTADPALEADGDAP
jgi:Tol biopolymer transport system component